jgi:addiction module RelB/DinJ family antitoxin
MKQKMETIRTTVEHSTKVEVENILNQLGITSSDVIRMLYAQIAMTKSVPFELKVHEQVSKHNHTRETIEVFEKIDRGEEVHNSNLEELRKEMGL